jgi:hypothetical protein
MENKHEVSKENPHKCKCGARLVRTDFFTEAELWEGASEGLQCADSFVVVVNPTK